MDSDDARQEVILVVRPIPQDPVEGLRGIFAAVGSVMGSAMESAATTAMDAVATLKVGAPPVVAKA